MNYFKINGRTFNVVVTAIEENFTILYSENTGRTASLGAEMTLDPLGTFYGHVVTVKRKKGYERDFDNLYNLVSRPVYDGWDVEIVHNQETISYRAYISNGTRALKVIDEKNNTVHWDALQLNIVPKKAQVLPE